MSSVAGLALWALLLAGEIDSRCSLVLIHEDAPVERLEVPCSEAGRYRDGVYGGWIWNRRRPPVRFSRTEPFDWSATTDSADRLRVTLAGVPREGRHASRLLSAPIQMWEEVPESLLPAWPLAGAGEAEIPTERDSSWRLRLVDGDRGTWWVDREVPTGTLGLVGVPAERLEIEVVDQAGAPVEGSTVRILEPAAGLADSRVLAVFQGDTQGRLAIASMPADRPAALVVAGSGSIPRVLEGRLRGLPRRIALEPGAELSGRFVADDGLPLGEVRAHVRSWLPGDAAMTYGLDATSDDTGRWSLIGVPPGEAVLVALKGGRGRLRRTIQVDRPTTDLGDLVLLPGAALEVRVIDDTGSVVPGAKIATDTGAEIYTDARGVAVLEALEPGRSLKVAASAAGHLKRDLQTLVEPGTGRIELVLERAHTVVGRLVDDSGVPVAGGTVRAIAGRRSSHEAVGPDGRFEVWLEARRPAILALASERSLEIQVPVAGGEPGSVTELGDVAMPSGATVTGRVLDGSTALPVPGARIWVPRADAKGPMVAWVRGDLLESRTDTEGLFRLMGLGLQPSLLRIEAPGYARRHLSLASLESSDDEVDLGEVYLSAGVSLTVEVDPPPATAAGLRVDLRNEWLEPDMLRAPVIAGSATVDHVPPGPVTLSVVSGRELLCIREIEVPAGVGTFEADCAADGHVVDGTVLRGGRPLGPGRLVWQPPSLQVVASIVRREQFGLGESTVYGGGRPSVDSPVAPDGTFSSTRLGPGDWRVVWSSESETPGAPIQVHLRDEPRQEVTIVVPGGVVHGRVTDAEGNSVASARVRLTPGGALAFSDGEGAFEIGGVASGAAFLRARLGDQVSDVVQIQLVDGVVSDPVFLVLGDGDDPETRVRVLEHDGEPAVGALLFLEDDRGRWRVLTADQSGSAKMPPQMPPAGRNRLAVLHRGRWTLGEWIAADEPLEVVLTDADAAGLRIWTDQDHEGPLRIRGPGSWDLSWIMTRAGLRPVLRPGLDLEVAGLPAGTYSVSLGTTSTTVVLSPGEIAEVRLD